MKRGEISMEVIIIAAIALLVLVILTILVINSGGKVSTECTNMGGTCGTRGGCESGQIESPNTGGCPKGDGVVCCLKITGN